MNAGLSGPTHLVALDSDGSVFPNMPLKFELMRDSILDHFELRGVATAAAEVIRFFNLESRWRGRHRFILLLRIMERLPDHPAVRAARLNIPDLAPLRRYLEQGGELSHEALEAAAAGDAVLERVVAWSRDFSARLAELPPTPPMPEAVAALRRLSQEAVWVVVSQAPREQLIREWTAAGLLGCVADVRGSEAGSKARQIRAALADFGFSADRAMVVGDAAGDLDAARETGALFFPIRPGRESESWRRLLSDAWPAFRAGDRSAELWQREVAAFEAAWPSEPPWGRAGNGAE